MIKPRSLILKSLTVFVFTLLFVGFSNGQILQQDLNQSFKSFKLFRLETARTSSPAGAGFGATDSLTVPAGAKNYVLNLMPRDLRAPNYRAEVTSAAGVRPLAFDSVKTFRGKVSGENNSEVRLTIDGDKVEGYFNSGAEKFFIEPARRYSQLAAETDLIVYREEDYRNPETFSCRSQLGEKIESGKQMTAAQTSQALQTLRVLELATEADYEFVNANGGAAQANNEILSILNMVEGVYESQLGLSIDVVFQHAWTTPDGYSGANADALLRSFQANWNVHRGDVSRDAAHIWTAKPNAVSQGYAFLHVICVNPSYAYGLSGRVTWAPAKFDITAHEIGHNLNANHADAGECENTVMNTTLSATTPLTFCSLSRSEITNYVAANGSCLSPRVVTNPGNSARFDFDGDGKSDTSVFRAANGIWAILNSATGSYNGFQFGQIGDKPVPSDYDGDGKTDAAVFRNGAWYRLRSTTGTFDTVYFGTAGDIPAPADFDGDGKADAAVFRPSTGYWFRLNSADGALSAVQFGAAGDVPMPADFDGDGKGDITLWRPANGIWYRLNSQNNSFFGAQFGTSGDRPVSGDFDGDGKYDLAVFRPSNGYWYAAYSGSGALLATPFGAAGDVPAPADFDGDGKTDLAVYRSGVWHRLTTANNAYSAIQFGLGGDTPAPSFYNQ